MRHIMSLILNKFVEQILSLWSDSLSYLAQMSQYFYNIFLKDIVILLHLMLLTDKYWNTDKSIRKNRFDKEWRWISFSKLFALYVDSSCALMLDLQDILMNENKSGSKPHYLWSQDLDISNLVNSKIQ